MPNFAKQDIKKFFALFEIRLIRFLKANTFLTGLVLISVFFYSPEMAFAEKQFREVEVEKPFLDHLIQDPDFMHEGGARIFEGDGGEMALIGVGTVVTNNYSPESIQKARRKGEIQARTKILELKEGVEISTSRRVKEDFSSDSKTGEKISLSSFFQVTEARVEGLVQQFPIVGTWWSKDRMTLYVAVGKILKSNNQKIDTLQTAKLRNTARTKVDFEGEEPFIAILKNSPILCKNGGIRGFLLSDSQKIIIAVNSAAVKKSIYEARRVARLKAIRSLLGHRENLKLSSVEYLADKEELRVYENAEKHVLLSNFLSIQEEQVSGMIKALPIIATWKDSSGQIIYVSVGKFIDIAIE